MKVKISQHLRKNGMVIAVRTVNRSRYGAAGSTLLEQTDRNGDGEERARAWAESNGHEVAN